jgi:hypothetical protein
VAFCFATLSYRFEDEVLLYAFEDVY